MEVWIEIQFVGWTVFGVIPYDNNSHDEIEAAILCLVLAMYQGPFWLLYIYKLVTPHKNPLRHKRQRIAATHPRDDISNLSPSSESCLLRFGIFIFLFLFYYFFLFSVFHFFLKLNKFIHLFFIIFYFFKFYFQF